MCTFKASQQHRPEYFHTKLSPIFYNKIAPTHVHDNLYFADQTRSILVVETLPILGFVSDDTLEVEASYYVALIIAIETAYNWGMTY